MYPRASHEDRPQDGPPPEYPAAANATTDDLHDEETVTLVSDPAGAIPRPRGAQDAALLDEPTSEVPVIGLPGTDPDAEDVANDDVAAAATTPESPTWDAEEDPTILLASPPADTAGASEPATAEHTPFSPAEPDDTSQAETEQPVQTTPLSQSDPIPEPPRPAATPPVTSPFGPPPGAPPAEASGAPLGAGEDEAEPTLDPLGQDDAPTAGPDAAAEPSSEDARARATDPVDDAPATTTGDAAATPVERPVALWSDEDADRLRGQWRELQSQFIDDPAAAVAGAQALVTEAVQELADTLLTVQQELDPHRAGEQVDTEAMRLAMRRYREFLDRVLAL